VSGQPTHDAATIPFALNLNFIKPKKSLREIVALPKRALHPTLVDKGEEMKRNHLPVDRFWWG
jgi:hypothetical protein